MTNPKINRNKQEMTNTVKSMIRDIGVDLMGFADLKPLKRMPTGVSSDWPPFLSLYQYAVVMSSQIGKFGTNVPAKNADLFLEEAALKITDYLIEDLKRPALTIHPEDEFDFINRKGLLSLKVLAKGAGLGWQGRSLLIISPEYGPIHRLIAVLTDLPLIPDHPIANQCGNCSLCVDKCPKNSLTLTHFNDHPRSREDVLNLNTCLVDDGCMICLKVCPWLKVDPTFGINNGTVTLTAAAYAGSKARKGTITVSGPGIESQKITIMQEPAASAVGQAGRIGTIPLEFQLSQNYPNPFNPLTTIRFGLPNHSRVTLKIHNLLGEEMMTFADKEFTAGWHFITLDASQLESGIYFYTIKADGFLQTKKMIVMR